MSVTLFDTIKMELEAMSPEDLMEPIGEVEDGEEMVGEANLELKKLYILWQTWERTAMETMLRVRYARSKKEMEEALSMAAALSRKSDLVKNLFWSSVREAFGLWDKDTVSIRRGWKITWSESDDSLPPFIKELFGSL